MLKQGILESPEFIYDIRVSRVWTFPEFIYDIRVSRVGTFPEFIYDIRVQEYGQLVNEFSRQ